MFLHHFIFISWRHPHCTSWSSRAMSSLKSQPGFGTRGIKNNFTWMNENEESGGSDFLKLKLEMNWRVWLLPRQKQDVVQIQITASAASARLVLNLMCCQVDICMKLNQGFVFGHHFFFTSSCRLFRGYTSSENNIHIHHKRDASWLAERRMV